MPSHGRGHWFETSIAHPGETPAVAGVSARLGSGGVGWLDGGDHSGTTIECSEVTPGGAEGHGLVREMPGPAVPGSEPTVHVVGHFTGLLAGCAREFTRQRPLFRNQYRPPGETRNGLTVLVGASRTPVGQGPGPRRPVGTGSRPRRRLRPARPAVPAPTGVGVAANPPITAAGPQATAGSQIRDCSAGLTALAHSSRRP